MWFILLLATHEQFFILEGSAESNEISWKCCLCNLNRTHFFGREQFIPNRDEKGKASLDDGKCSSRFLTFETYFDHVISKFTRAPGIHPRALLLHDSLPACMQFTWHPHEHLASIHEHLWEVKIHYKRQPTSGIQFFHPFLASIVWSGGCSMHPPHSPT